MVSIAGAGLEAIRLEPPHAGLLAGYVAALRTGWSPSNVRDLSAEHLASIEIDPAAFLAGYDPVAGSTVTMPDGSRQERLPGQVYWISDGSFCGFVSLRWVPGSVDLPPHVSGHVGYGVVPLKRRQRIASRALLALLPFARAAGLRVLMITANPENVASRRVIEGAGGVLAPDIPASDVFGPRVCYRVETGLDIPSLVDRDSSAVDGNWYARGLAGGARET